MMAAAPATTATDTARYDVRTPASSASARASAALMDAPVALDCSAISATALAVALRKGLL